MTHSESNKIVSPVYQQIALDIANKVLDGRYPLGERLHGRSSLAGQYNVSPETIRRALYLLKDVGIVEIQHGIGAEVVSVEKAADYIARFQSISTFAEQKEQLLHLVGEQQRLEAKLQNALRDFIEGTEQYKYFNPYTPFEIRVQPQAALVGQTPSSCNFWQNTGATIIAIKREEELVLSPGPYIAFEPGDVVVVVGSEEAYRRAKELICGRPSGKEEET